MEPSKTTSDKLEAVERLLHEAMQLAPPNRESFIANISDTGVRDEVASLLAADADPGSGIGTVVAEEAALTGQPLAGRLLGQTGQGPHRFAQRTSVRHRWL